MTSCRLLFPLMALLTGGCFSIRPTVSGQIVNSMKQYPEPVEVVWGVIVSVHETGNPAALASTTSDTEGKFSCKGESGFPLMMHPDQHYQVRFHRDDYNDAVYDFSYHIGGPFSWLDQKRIGRIQLRPHWADAPSSAPSSKPVVSN